VWQFGVWARRRVLARVSESAAALDRLYVTDSLCRASGCENVGFIFGISPRFWYEAASVATALEP
jgi:hypothetical protein